MRKKYKSIWRYYDENTGIIKRSHSQSGKEERNPCTGSPADFHAQFPYPFLFDDRRVMVKAYTQETILAEKYETIIRRNVGNTRARDFYDLHLLYRLYRENTDWDLLKQAVLATAKKRDSLSVLQNTKRILQALEKLTILQDLWKRYQAQNLYAKEITYPDIMETVNDFTEKMNFQQKS